MRAEDKWCGAAVCGATGGIGRALVRRLARAGVPLSLAGRNPEALEAARVEALSLGAPQVRLCRLDLRDRQAAAAWGQAEADRGTDLLIVASGVSASVEDVSRHADAGEDRSGSHMALPELEPDLLRELDVNAAGAILVANAFVRRMLENRRRADACGGRAGRVQVGLISSLAAMTGLAGSPGYSASKAALRIYGEALRRLCASEGIGVTVLLPGYVESEMSRRYQGAKPFLMPADRAAAIMLKALRRNRAECAFPAILAWGIRALSLLPECLQGVFLKSFFFTVEPDAESRALQQGQPSQPLSAASVRDAERGESK